jgi:hypothetical protein
MNSADKGAPDIVLLDRSESTRNQTPQPSNIARRMDIASDDSWPEDRQALEAYPLNRFFFQPHDPHIADPAFCGASHSREQRELRDTSGVATSGKTTDNLNFEGLQFRLAPLHAAFTDAHTGCPKDRIALRNHILRKPGHFCRKLSSSWVHNHLPQARICGQSNRSAIDHHDFSAGRLGSQRTHHRSSDLPRATDDQDSKCQFRLPVQQRLAARRAEGLCTLRNNWGRGLPLRHVTSSSSAGDQADPTRRALRGDRAPFRPAGIGNRTKPLRVRVVLQI